MLLGGLRCRWRRICSCRRTRRGADATTVLTFLLRAAVFLAVFLARTLFTLIQHHQSRSASATTTRRQYRLDGDAGLAHPVRPRGCFSASLAFFFLIALALGAHAGLVIASERGAFSREPGERALSTGENRVIKAGSRAPPAFFSRPVAWTQPTRPRGLAWAPQSEERETKKF